MVSPWMMNGSAISYLQRKPNADRLRLLAQAAEGVNYLHTFHPLVVHGDLRGPNILVSESGDACIADFGLAHVAAKDNKHSYSTKWKLAGNPRWMAPELLFGDGADRTPATDVFSFGRLIIELLTGEHPFCELENIASVIVAVEKGDLPQRPDGDAVTWGSTRIYGVWSENVAGRRSPKGHKLMPSLRGYGMLNVRAR